MRIKILTSIYSQAKYAYKTLILNILVQRYFDLVKSLEYHDILKCNDLKSLSLPKKWIFFLIALARGCCVLRKLFLNNVIFRIRFFKIFLYYI